jgi:hypothetical protein
LVSVACIERNETPGQPLAFTALTLGGGVFSRIKGAERDQGADRVIRNTFIELIRLIGPRAFAAPAKRSFAVIAVPGLAPLNLGYELSKAVIAVRGAFRCWRSDQGAHARKLAS